VALVKNGHGLTALADFVVHEDIMNGHLQPVLQDYHLKPLGVCAVYPHREHLPPKVRIFMEFLTKHCDQAQWAIPREHVEGVSSLSR